MHRSVWVPWLIAAGIFGMLALRFWDAMSSAEMARQTIADRGRAFAESTAWLKRGGDYA